MHRRAWHLGTIGAQIGLGLPGPTARNPNKSLNDPDAQIANRKRALGPPWFEPSHPRAEARRYRASGSSSAVLSAMYLISD